jgi:hypothetical protein
MTGSGRKETMRISAVLIALVILVGSQSPREVGAQSAVEAMQPLVGTWKLVGLQRGASAQSLAPVANPVGILIQAGNGIVIEVLSQAGRAASLNEAQSFNTYQASWGSVSVDPGTSTARYRIRGDLDQRRMGQQATRSFERKGTQLVITESAVAGLPATRTTWDRIPDLEALPDYQRDAVGMWQWVSAGLFNAKDENVRPAYRDESLIVYTPTGHMAVLYLGPPGRKTFAGATPTVEEARAAMLNAVSYYGTYIVQPRTKGMFHYQLGASSPTAVGGSFMRNFEITGTQLRLLFPPQMLDGQQVQNRLVLKRLSGLTDMLPTGAR